MIPDAPDNLTGDGGRRQTFGLAGRVSERTVKAWKAKAIAAFVTALIEPSEWLETMAVIFFLADHLITHKSETRFWNNGTDLHTETIKVENHGGLLPQLCSRPARCWWSAEATLEIYLLFRNDSYPRAPSRWTVPTSSASSTWGFRRLG